MKQAIKFNVGDGATVHGYSDSRSYTVIAVSKGGKKITLQRDRVKLLNGADSGEPDALKVYPGGFAAHTEGRQRWDTQPDSNGPVTAATLRKDGHWRQSGCTDSGRVSEGRSERYDYNF
jgi:hypothetical protein